MNGTLTFEVIGDQTYAVIRLPVSFDLNAALAAKQLRLNETPHLTRREREVLALVVRGKANKEIANTIGLSERTVKFHVSSLLLKARVSTRFELVSALMGEIYGCNNGSESSGSSPGGGDTLSAAGRAPICFLPPSPAKNNSGAANVGSAGRALRSGPDHTRRAV